MLYQYMVLAMTICAGFGFVYGLIHLIWPRKAQYTHMIVYGMGCVMIGRLFQTVSIFAFGELTSGFNLGMLGIIGCFQFFFTANYGVMDSLVDDGSKKYRKVRLTALAAPAVILALFGVYVYFAGIGIVTAVRFAGVLIIAATAYLHLKHILIEDVEFGLIRAIRRYNILGLAYAILTMLEMIVAVAPISPFFMIIVYQLICLVYLLIIPELEKGVKKWTI